MDSWKELERAQDAALAAASKSSKWHQTILVREAKKSLGGLGRLRDWVLGECVTQQQRAAVRETAAGVVAVEGKAAQEQAKLKLQTTTARAQEREARRRRGGGSKRRRVERSSPRR